MLVLLEVVELMPMVTALLKLQRSSLAKVNPLFTYSMFAHAVSTLIPEPFAKVADAAPLATIMFLSSTVITVELIVVVVPLTVKQPVITTF